MSANSGNGPTSAQTIDGVELVPGSTYEAGNDYETDVAVFGREIADMVRKSKAESRPRGVYIVGDVGSASKPFRMTRS